MTSDPRTWMWAEAMEMLDRAERLQRRFFQPARPALRPTWEPPLDIYETDDAYWLVIALPGVRPDDIEIAIDGGFLTVVGERPIPLRSARIHRLEIPHGRFERRIELPPGRLEVGRRELVDGCLLVSLRKL